MRHIWAAVQEKLNMLPEESIYQYSANDVPKKHPEVNPCFSDKMHFRLSALNTDILRVRDISTLSFSWKKSYFQKRVS